MNDVDPMNDAVAELRSARSIAIVSHRDPDPDTIGSAIALGLALERMGKTLSLHCADAVPEGQRFLSGAERFLTTPPAEDVDLVVTVDFGSKERAKFALPSRPRTLNIDHHASNDHFADVNLVDVKSAASAELVSRVIDALGAPWTSEMATAALVGIMTDTGSFQFPSTDARALDRAARLREAGADLQAITYNIFRNKRFEALRLWGFAFSRMRREFDGQLVWTEITQDDFRDAGAKDEDISGLVEQVARSSGMRVALFFNAQPRAVKVSCRTSAWEPSVDAAALMSRWGGGGHVRAAGALIPGTLADVREPVLAAARGALSNAPVR
ncbi:MAG TPA: bifunctional oligoribonuclease/PAP phosphatase NrnA [Candidatus Limnocylindrales bacterium]|nr:bifunctional oligoribonuclease/PAP phosphatase NrnA [Candidatus Limnocylindrales bacterium]